MKKKIYLITLSIVTIICVIAGLCFHTVRFGLSFFDQLHLPFFSEEPDSDDDLEKMTASDVIQLDNFTSLFVEASVMDLDIEKGEQFTIRYSGSEKLFPSYEVKNGILTVRQTGKTHSIWGNNKCHVTITIPEKLSDAQITSDVGDVDLEQLEIDSLTLTADVGDIDISDCTFTSAELSADVGDIDWENSSFVSLNVTNDVGKTIISSPDDLSDYDMDLQSDIGDVKVNAQKEHKSYLQNGDNSKKLVVKNSVGDVTVSFP